MNDLFVIPLVNSDKISVVSVEDTSLILENKWRVDRDGYVLKVGTINLKQKALHQLLIPCENGFEVDHINRHRRDNTRRNLRKTTKGFNAHNREKYVKSRSNYKGVSYHQFKWRARISFQNKPIFIGHFRTEIEAAKAYNQKAIELYGETACINKL